MKELPDSLAKLREYPQFILCKLIPRDNGKTDKVPVDISGNPITAHDSANWLSADDAIASANVLNMEVGFVFTAQDPFWFLDIDGAFSNGKWSDLSTALCHQFKGAAIEVSSSCTGLHIFGCGTVPDHSCRNQVDGLEFYHEARFVCLTGLEAKGDIFLDWTPQISQLVENHFKPRTNSTKNDWRSNPVPEWDGIEDDQELLKKMLNTSSSQSAFGGKATFRDLWENNETVLAANYPPENDKDPYGRSNVDFAIANSLAFWTGKNHQRIHTFMNMSALVRDKWVKHKNYLANTISRAVDGCENVHSKKPRQQEEVVIPDNDGSDMITPLARVGSQYMSPQQQLEHFKDCIYIKQSHRILTPNGNMLKPEVFKASYAGYTFALDAENIKTTKNAFEAFIDNQAISFPKVDGTCFQPKLAPYTIINDDGVSRVNSYIPINVPRKKGDVSLFLNHIKNMFPLEQDYDVIMAYMAAVVQYKGTKFQWCPIIQGVEGNGKTLIGRVLEAAVGQKYSHFPNASDLGGNGLKFNGWIAGKLFIFIEEIYTSDRRELTEPMKVFITNDRIEIQSKGQDQYTGDNVANIIMCSNHKDCMKLGYDQRRYWMHFCPQQTVEDLIKVGMTSAYFTQLYNWLKTQNGYAMVTDYLMDYQIPDELNPSTSCQRAPHSTSRDESITLSLGIVEQHIMEAIDDERQGFKNGYISSKALKDLLVEIKKDGAITPQRRTAILESLGYVKHPWLNKGRTNNPVAAEGSKITIFTNLIFPVVATMNRADIKEIYETAQGYIVPKLEAVK